MCVSGAAGDVRKILHKSPGAGQHSAELRIVCLRVGQEDEIYTRGVKIRMTNPSTIL